jgi:putative transposase
MKKSRFSERQIVKILQEHESGVRESDLCRQHNISEGTFYNWKKKYSGMDSDQLSRLKELETENSRLKRMFADLSLENEMIKEVLKKKF